MRQSEENTLGDGQVQFIEACSAEKIEQPFEEWPVGACLLFCGNHRSVCVHSQQSTAEAELSKASKCPFSTARRAQDARSRL